MSDDYRSILQALVDRKDLSEARTYAVFTEMMDGRLSEVQTAGLLLAMETKGCSVGEITGAARAMRDHAVKIHVGGATVVDIVGTGGTGISTFNVSTTSCFVAAGAGAKVAKHGNVTNTRASGSANVLEALGVNLMCAPETVAKCIAEAGVGFCFARALHPAMKFVAPVRKQIPVRTIFNVLGPLTNPAGATRQILGVYCEAWVRPLAEVLGQLGADHAWVVHGQDGCDDVSITGPTSVCEWKDGELRSFQVAPQDVGLTPGTLDDLQVADAAESAERVRSIVAGEIAGPCRDIVLLNAGAALVVAGIAADLSDGVQKAAESIDTGQAKVAMESLIRLSQE